MRFLVLPIAAFAVACADPAPFTSPGRSLPMDGPRHSLGLANDATADTLLVGESVHLSASGVVRRKGRALGPAAIWTSSNDAVATVSTSGVVTAVGAGTTVVAATSGVYSDSATIVVIGVDPPPAPPAPAPIPVAPPADSPAELPRVQVNTEPVPVTGTTHRPVTSDGLQAALDAARPGDLIELVAGTTYTGNFVLPAKTGAGWITIRSSESHMLPAGERVGPAQASFMARIVSPNFNAPLRTDVGAHHYRLIGLEVTAPASVSAMSALILLGSAEPEQRTLSDVPTHLVLDRMYVHGHPGLNFQRCVAMNSAHTAVIDSYLSECHGKGFDSQAIVGWNGPGPFRIVNNYLEGAGENVMFGGADPTIPGLIPSDIEIRRNHFNKPDSWRGVWSVKNLFELKSGHRVLIEGNVFTNNWVDAQAGFAIVLKSSSACQAAWTETRDVTFRLNVVRDSPHAVAAAGSPESCPVVPMNRVYIGHNLFERISGRLWQFSEVDGLMVEHNTGFGGTHGLIMYGGRMAGFVVRDNVMGTSGASESDAYPLISADGKGLGTMVLDAHAIGWTFSRNVVTQAGNVAGFPANNQYVPSVHALGMVAYPTNMQLLPSSNVFTSGTGGKAPGVDFTVLRARTAGVILP